VKSENVILNSIIPDANVLTELLYSDNARPKYLKTILITNKSNLDQTISVIIDSSIENITDNSYLHYEYIVEANDTIYLNEYLNFKNKQIVFVKTSGNLIVKAIGDE
jgi:hypothetical protein